MRTANIRIGDTNWWAFTGELPSGNRVEVVHNIPDQHGFNIEKMWQNYLYDIGLLFTGSFVAHLKEIIDRYQCMTVAEYEKLTRENDV